MLETNKAKELNRITYLAVIASALTCSLSLLVPVLTFAYSDNYAVDNRYSLIGSLELSYDRRWSQSGAGAAPATNDFRQSLQLDNYGYVLDPQLLTYNLSGLVSRDSGNGSENATLLGESLGLTLFRTLPNKLQKNSDYIPHPVWLRFSHDANPSFETTNYGISFMHSVSPKQRFLVTEEVSKPKGEDADLYEEGPSQTSKIVEKERDFPVPRTFFDYDHYDQNFQGSRTVNNIISLRSSLTGTFYDYQFLYTKQNQTGSQVLNRSLVQLIPIYQFYDEQTRRRIEIRNLISYEEGDQGNITQLNNGLNWTRPIGTDELSLRSDLGYFNSSSAGQTLTNSSASVSGTYTQHISPRLTNSTHLLASLTKNDTNEKFASYTKNTTIDNHSERLSDTVSVDISRIFMGVASAFVGNSSQGPEYGAAVTLSTKTRINTSLSYSYSLSSVQNLVSTNLTQQTTPYLTQQILNERISKHSVNLRSSGPLLNNLSFQAGAEATIADVPVVAGTATAESLTVSGNFLWQVLKTSMTLGGNYTQMNKAASAIYSTTLNATNDLNQPQVLLRSDSSTSSTSLYATLSRTLPMNMLFNFYSTWTRTSDTGMLNSDSTTRVEIRPTLRWARGLSTVYAEYSYASTTGGGATNTDNRFFVRLVRNFSTFF